MANADTGAAVAPEVSAPFEALVENYEALLKQVDSNHPPDKYAVYQLLVVRDQIAAAGRDGTYRPPVSLAKRVCTLDDALRRLSNQIAIRGKPDLEDLRDSVQPPEQNWWWPPKPSPNPLWTIGAVLLLTVSVTMITDFTRRILSSDPDALGIAAIALQAILGVAASSTFSEGGWRWIEDLLLRRGVPPQSRPRWKLGVTLLLFLLVATAWKLGPLGLAMYYRYYNDVAYHADANGSPDTLQFYKRAIALDPQMPQAHFNLATLYERRYDYDKAMEEYQQTILVDPSHVKAYANLSRLLILTNQPQTALRVASDGTKIAPKNDPTLPALNKDLAWAEDQLGFYSDAEADAKQALQSPDMTPSAYCVLGKIYTHWGKPELAQQAWKNFTASIRNPKIHPPIIEPDCTRLAEATLNEKQ